jgi:hypothetical protein
VGGLNQVDSDKELQSVTDTVVKCLSGADVDAGQVRDIMGSILALLRQRDVPTDTTGTLGLTTHIANFISRFKSSVEVDYPSGFEGQIPEEDLLIAREVAGIVSDSVGAKIPRPEIALIGSHIAAMKLRSQSR